MHGSGVIRLAKIYRPPTDYRQVRLVTPPLSPSRESLFLSFDPRKGSKCRRPFGGPIYRTLCLPGDLPNFSSLLLPLVVDSTPPPDDRKVR